RPAEELEPLSRALVQRVVGAHCFGMALAEPLEPVPGSDLFVGAGREDEVARGLEPLARQRGERDCLRRDLPFHVERAAAAELTVATVAGPRVGEPLAGIGRNRVRVREQQQARAVTAARNPRDEVGALRRARVELALDAVVAEVVAQKLGGLSLVARR